LSESQIKNTLRKSIIKTNINFNSELTFRIFFDKITHNYLLKGRTIMYNIIPMGTLGNGETTVSEKNTAKTLGSGGLDVFATPAMILLMENTAAESVAKFLD